MRRIASLLLAALLAVAALPALAEDVHTSGLYTYEFKGNGTITITRFDMEANGGEDIFVPNQVDGYTIAGIGDEAFRCDAKQENAVSVTLPESVTSIGRFAFWGANLREINIPDSVQYIGPGAFVGCELCHFKLANSQPAFAVIDSCLYNKAQREFLAIGRIPLSQDELAIPEGIVSIADYALYEVDMGTCRLKLPSTLERIGEYSFYDANLVLQEGTIHREADPLGLPGTALKSVGAYAFSKVHGTSFPDDNEDWMRLTFPATLESIGEHAFEEAKACVDLSVADKLTEIPEAAFNKAGSLYSKFALGDTTRFEKIGDYNQECGEFFTGPECFSPKLTSIPVRLYPWTNELPDTVTEIQSDAMFTTKDVKLSAKLSYIADDAFPEGSTFIVEHNTYAEMWAQQNGFAFSYAGEEADMSWLNGPSGD